MTLYRLLCYRLVRDSKEKNMELEQAKEIIAAKERVEVLQDEAMEIVTKTSETEE